MGIFFFSPSWSNGTISFRLRMAKFFFLEGFCPEDPGRRMGRRSASCYLLHLAAGPWVMKLEVEQGTPQGIPLQASLLAHRELVCFAWMLCLFYIHYLKAFPLFLLIVTPFLYVTQNTLPPSEHRGIPPNPTKWSNLFLKLQSKNANLCFTPVLWI